MQWPLRWWLGSALRTTPWRWLRRNVQPRNEYIIATTHILTGEGMLDLLAEAECKVSVERHTEEQTHAFAQQLDCRWCGGIDFFLGPRRVFG